MSKAKDYAKKKITLEIISIILGISLMFILGFTYFGEVLALYFQKMQINRYISFLLYSILSILAIMLLNLPLSIYEEYLLEKKYSMTNMSIKSWIIKYFKELILSIIIGSFLMEVLYVFLVTTGKSWWIGVFFFLIFFNIILGMLAPILIFPIFYKFTEIENENLKEKIEKVLREAKITFKGIYKFNLSKDSNKANAAFTGIGKTKRILLSDTLIDSFSEEEIIAVFSHEMGHFLKKHILKSMLYSFTVLFITLFCISFYTFDDFFNFSNIFKIGFFLSLMQNIVMVFDNFYSRKHEYEADKYAKEMGNKEFLISALQKLSEKNLADTNPNPIVEFIFHSHPSIEKRIAKLKGE